MVPTKDTHRLAGLTEIPMPHTHGLVANGLHGAILPVAAERLGIVNEWQSKNSIVENQIVLYRAAAAHLKFDLKFA